MDASETGTAPVARARTEVVQKTLLLAFTAAMLFRELRLPGTDIDLSWMLATLYGFLNRIDFGHYLIISYGPLDFLTSGLFHPATWRLTILFELLCAGLALWPALGLR